MEDIDTPPYIALVSGPNGYTPMRFEFDRAQDNYHAVTIPRTPPIKDRNKAVFAALRLAEQYRVPYK